MQSIIDLFDKYFLILMVVLGFLVGIIDSNRFKRNGFKNAARKAKLLGLSAIAISIVLFVVRSYK